MRLNEEAGNLKVEHDRKPVMTSIRIRDSKSTLCGLQLSTGSVGVCASTD